MKINKTLITVGVIVLFLIILISWIVGKYNTLVTRDEGVTNQWKQVEVAYQARMDKTKNLLEIVKGAANFEKSTLTEVIEARSKATSIQINAENLTPDKIAAFEAAQQKFGQSLGRLMAIAENYPQLQSVGAFRDFQAQYEGMENRIATERRKFNDMVNDYNKYVRKFPNSIFANMFGFQKKDYFSAQQGAETAPDIKLN
ncbi:MAG: LemA family protein [Lentimicrobiaceae bacterium]|nr:LemA family protein [Lentimicrobiaceae bacterium]